MTAAAAPEKEPDDANAKPEPQMDHDWLHRLIGDWSFEGECIMDTSEPPTKSTGDAKVRSLNGLWILCEGTGDAPDGVPVNSVITLGYDPHKAPFVGSFVASCMTNHWIYEGTLYEVGKVLTLDTEGPGFSDEGSLAPYQDLIEIESDEHWTLKSRMRGEDGQ